MVHCFAPGCKTSYPSSRKQNKLTGKRNLSTFKAPSDPELLAIWQKVIPRKDKLITPNDRLCELHFDEECIEKFYETKLADGSLFKIERGKYSLKPDSVPTKFPNVPGYPSNPKWIWKRRAPVLNDGIEKQICLANKLLKGEPREESQFEPSEESQFEPNEESQFEPNEESQFEPNEESQFEPSEESQFEPSEESQFEPSEESQFEQSEESQFVTLFEIEKIQSPEFIELTQKLEEVKIPDLSWTIFFHQGYIMCASWDNFTAKRRVIVFGDLSVKIFLKNIEISETYKFSLVVKNVEILSLLLQQVNNLPICNGVEPEIAINCPGYVDRGPNSQCSGCKKVCLDKTKEEKSKHYWRVKLQMVRNEKNHILRRNRRLIRKTARLKALIEGC